jgi:hypothetical protein
MSAEAAADCAAAGSPAAEAERVRRQALRIAFAVAGGMVMMVAAGWPMPFLVPMFAAQFLVASRRPMQPAQAFGMAILIISVGQVLALAVGLLGDRPVVLLAVLWLLYFACFLAQARGRSVQAMFLVLVIAVMVPLMEMLQQDLDRSMVALLVAGVMGGTLLAWAAHAVFPDPGCDGGTAAAQAPAAAERPAHRAAANASILLAAVVLCLVDSRLSSAIVIPVTVASLLGQFDLAKSRRAALGLMVVNIMGGVVASLAFTIVEARPTLLGLFLVVLLVGLLFGAAASAKPETGKVHAGALTTFLILLGLGISPLPASTPESFATRIAYVSFAVLYALWACLLLWPRRSETPGPGVSTPRAREARRCQAT